MNGSTYGREGVGPSSSLGALREEFGRSERVRRQYAVFAGVGFVLGLLFTAAGAWLPGSIFLALGVFMTWGLLRQRGLRVRVFEHGFAYTRGRRTREFAWDDIEAFSESQQVYKDSLTGLRSGTGYSYFVRRRDGESLKMDNEVGGVRELGERLREETLKRLLPRAAESVARGEAAHFGKYTLTREAVAHGERRLAWADVGRVDAAGGMVVVVDRDGREWAGELYGFVPNAHVLLALAQRLKFKNF